MFCQKCGTKLPDNAVFCSSCGTSVAAPNPTGLTPDKFKDASKDALEAFKLFASNPVGGLAAAFERVGPTRALGVGIAFGGVFALCIVVAVYRLLPEWGRPHGFGGFLKILVVAIVPFVSLLGANVAARNAFKGEGGLGHESFVSGASLLPFGCVALVAGILGFGNIEVLAVVSLFAACLTILMLFAGLTRICKISERAATLAVPLMLIASAWLSKIIYTAMVKEM